jgi:hypothetical protein
MGKVSGVFLTVSSIRYLVSTIDLNKDAETTKTAMIYTNSILGNSKSSCVAGHTRRGVIVNNA